MSFSDQNTYEEQDVISGLNLSFDAGVAKKCGMGAAVLFNHICYWLKQNQHNPKALRDGRVWMYESQEKMANFLDFFTEREIKSYIKILLDFGLIEKDNFNNNPFDRTNWYTLPDFHIKKIFTKVQICTIQNTKNVPSESTKNVPCNKEEDLNKRPNKRTTTEEPKKSSEKSSDESKSRFVVDEKKYSPIFFTNSKGVKNQIFESDIYRHFLKSNFSNQTITEAIEIAKMTKDVVNVPLKYIEGICYTIQKNLKSYPVDPEKEAREKIKNIQKEEYQRKVEEHKKMPKGRIRVGTPR